MKVEFDREALAEFVEAAAHYAECSPALRHRFEHAVEHAVRRIAEQPHLYPAMRGDVRRCPLSTFPYSVLYAVQGDLVFVIAVMHGKRDPDSWLGRR